MCPRVSQKKTLFDERMAQTAVQVFGGWFEGNQRDFLFWQVLVGVQDISVLPIFTFSLIPYFSEPAKWRLSENVVVDSKAFIHMLDNYI